jgi:hypothetical protein
MDPKVAGRVRLVDGGQNLRLGELVAEGWPVGAAVPSGANENRRRTGGGSRCVGGWAGPDQATWILLVTVFPVRRESTIQMGGSIQRRWLRR